MIDRTRRVPFDAVAVFQSGGRGLPTFGKSVLQKLVRARVLVPDGDRRHGTESSGVVNEEDVLVRDDYVVGEFVLGDDLRDRLRMYFFTRFARGPDEHVAEPSVAIDLGRDRRKFSLGQ